MTLGEACWLFHCGSMPAGVLCDLMEDIQDIRLQWARAAYDHRVRERRWLHVLQSWCCHRCGSGYATKLEATGDRRCPGCGQLWCAERELRPLLDEGLDWHDQWTGREQRIVALLEAVAD